MTDNELCNSESSQTDFVFIQFVRLYTIFNLSCHTCYYFIISVTTEKVALPFCIPYPAQMHGLLVEQHAATFRSLILPWTFITNQQLSKTALKKKRLLLMKRTPHLPSITKIQAHRAWSKKTGQNKPALCWIIKMLGV